MALPMVVLEGVGVILVVVVVLLMDSLVVEDH